MAFSANPIAVGGTTQASATPRDIQGNALSGRGAANWSILTGTSLATINGSGLVTGIAAGQVSIGGTIEGITGSAILTINPPPVMAVSVSLSANPINVGATSQATATPRDAQGNPLTGRAAPGWSLLAGGQFATISQTGLVTGVAGGLVSVGATIEGVTGSANLTVNAPVASVSVNLTASSIQIGQTSQASAITRDGAGNVLSGRSVSWSSDATTIASVNSGSGLVTGSTMGATNIKATSEGVIGSAPITISAPSSFGSGTRVVGVNIGPGTYRSNNSQAASCYRERLSGFGGTFAEIIANDIGSGPRVTTILGGDRGFNSSSCATWVLVTGPITSSPTAPFNDGVFVVGSDVAAGTWQSNGSGTSCYWARLSNFTRVNDIIANDFGNAPAVVTIAAGDAGFEASRCGTWTKVP